MEENNLWAHLYEQRHNTINGRGVWLYLVHTAIGQIWIVQWEQIGKELTEKIFYNNMDKAERLFDSKCKAIISGRA